MTHVEEDSWEDLNLAVACGLMRRWGPSPTQMVALPWWRRMVCRLLSSRHRWRIHPLAPMIRGFDRRSSTSAATGRGQR